MPDWHAQRHDHDAQKEEHSEEEHTSGEFRSTGTPLSKLSALRWKIDKK